MLELVLPFNWGNLRTVAAKQNKLMSMFKASSDFKGFPSLYLPVQLHTKTLLYISVIQFPYRSPLLRLYLSSILSAALLQFSSGEAQPRVKIPRG
jgi:hypothetical protein